MRNRSKGFYPRGIPVPREFRGVMLLGHIVGWQLVIYSTVMTAVHLAIKVLA